MYKFLILAASLTLASAYADKACPNPIYIDSETGNQCDMLADDKCAAPIEAYEFLLQGVDACPMLFPEMPCPGAVAKQPDGSFQGECVAPIEKP